MKENEVIHFEVSINKKKLYDALKSEAEKDERLLQKKPLNFHRTSLPLDRCPTCQRPLRLTEKHNKYPFCKYCGQAIDWTDYKVMK